MYFNRWIVFSASCCIQLSAGLNYGYSLFSPTLQKNFNLDELAVSSLASCGFNLGGYLAIFAGITYTYLSDRHNHIGPRAVLWIRAALLILGYLCIYAMVKGEITYSYPLLMTFALASGNAGPWLDTCVMSTCLRNFPDDRGSIVGILKAFLALSGSLLSLIFSTFFTEDPILFILFLAIAPPTFVVTLSLFVNRIPIEVTEVRERKETNSLRFAQVYCVIALLSVSACVMALLGAWDEIQDEGRKGAMVWLLLALAALFVIPMTAGPLTLPRRGGSVAQESAYDRGGARRAFAAFPRGY